ncbi:hypothetical protein P175DRAFT_0558996 [Aspergillus ochraceoroseus IBT 24754]|uniref:Uncharacterized protein n=1 Tax=Aspergillus ochraceoroseus IBT 24754 TaxID=1392256 RepID=A0A2T5LT18_9EURO|nr:uncharacterized protein P175DRAFT_0558996 [Aspergillus ochraceoroseus IBT 24754]PTU19433.1 hypothetical protein P175DRAFT_0558996 [Aspergillus ochraceoroseus IBT 24754]
MHGPILPILVLPDVLSLSLSLSLSACMVSLIEYLGRSRYHMYPVQRTANA